MKRRLVRLVCGALLATALGACDPPAPPVPLDNRVVFSSDYLGGFTGFPHDFDNATRLTVFADGRVVWHYQVRTTIYPQPALWMPVQMRVSAEGVQFVRRVAAQAGLTTAHRWVGPQTCIADVGYVRYVLDGAVTTVYGPGASCPLVTAEEVAARKALEALDGFILSPEVNLSKYQTEALRTMPFDQIAIAWQVNPPAGDPALAQTRAWPSELIPLGAASPRKVLTGFCEVRSGADAIGTWLLAAQSNTATVFTQGAAKYRVWFRPMLSSETDCVSMVSPFWNPVPTG